MIEGASTPVPLDLTELRVAITAGAGGFGTVIADAIAACGGRGRQHRQPELGGGEVRLRVAQPVCGREVGGGRVYPEPGDRAGTGRDPGQRDPARPGRGAADP